MSSNGKRTVLVCMAGVGVLGAVGHVTRKGGLPPTQMVAGGVITTALLAGLAEIAPKLAAALAGLALATSVVVVGGPAWEGIGRVTRSRAADLGAPSGALGKFHTAAVGG